MAMADSQKMASKAKSGGQRIEDHSFWAGGRSKGSVFPEGNKVKEFPSAEGAGEVTRYDDTSEDIKKMQMEGVRKIKARPMKDDDRN
jgi:hypothetical protein